MDFLLQMALVQGLTDGEIFYRDGLIKMYETLANDFIYADPDRLVVFPDNHDMHRFFTQVKGDLDLYKMGLAYILTIRGIPQVYYGTEVLMSSPGDKDDGVIRSDFPGGWKDDPVNVFTEKGLTPQQLEAKQFLQNLLVWRKTKSCLHDGKLIHFSPENGTYVYFRFNEKEKIMVAFNKNDKEVTLDGSRFKEITGGTNSGFNVISGKEQSLEKITIPARAVIIFEI
jgi:glycosidase